MLSYETRSMTLIRQGGRISSLLIQYDDSSQLHNDSNRSPLSIIDLYV